MDNRVMSIWKEEVKYPYIHGTLRSALLLDALESHVHSNFIGVDDEQGTKFIQIPGDFTLVCQPCDVRITKPFNTQLVEMCQAW